MTKKIGEKLTDLAEGLPHPQKDTLLNILLGVTGVSSSGYPFIAENSFTSFLAAVPHLFTSGSKLVSWLAALDAKIAPNLKADQAEFASIARAIKVLQNIVQTAAITAPPDLWVLRQVISTAKSFGLIGRIVGAPGLQSEVLAAEFGLNESYLRHDLRFLCSRGYLRNVDGRYFGPATSYLATTLVDLPQLEKSVTDADWYGLFVRWLSGNCTAKEEAQINEHLTLDIPSTRSHGWWANARDIEVGYRIVPLVLALHYSGFTSTFRAGKALDGKFDQGFAGLRKLLNHAGLVSGDAIVTTLGQRVFQKGPGPFGIIHAYRSYFVHHAELLRGNSAVSWVARGENVAASQEANRETFKSANSALDKFAIKYRFDYHLFIEHAVGQGEATRQRFEARGEASTQYFGADLEDAAIDRAIAAQREKKLPANMIFVRNADIGVPALLIDAIRGKGFPTQGAVMLVGNGFHEIRNQSNLKMVAVFREYCQAEILLLFTEESALSDADLIATGWNTYHAGFRYVHDISGQGLRPAADHDNENATNYSWKKCAELGGYQVLQEFTTRTRTIYPHPRQDGYNPSISVNYFCVPKNLCEKLAIPKESLT